MSRKRGSRLHPRPEQTAELTGRLTLPLSALADHHLTIIAETLARAWQDLLPSHETTMRTGDEAEINALMASRLNHLLDADPLWRALVSGVTRGSESLSHDGRHLEKRPDLSIHLTCRNPNFPLTVECKLLDHPNGKTVDRYCRQGLARFIEGEYAWTAREAFMLAYVRDGADIENSLTPHLAKARAIGTGDPFQTLDLPGVDSPPPRERARTWHGRPFRYLMGSTQPGPIVLWHIWLTVA
jgi:hypothetical protein